MNQHGIVVTRCACSHHWPHTHTPHIHSVYYIQPRVKSLSHGPPTPRPHRLHSPGEKINLNSIADSTVHSTTALPFLTTVTHFNNSFHTYSWFSLVWISWWVSKLGAFAPWFSFFSHRLCRQNAKCNINSVHWLDVSGTGARTLSKEEGPEGDPVCSNIKNAMYFVALVQIKPQLMLHLAASKC